jgi:endonuclease/exonuclease/phosphatase (EEP) superfamily protein YafD
MFRAAAVPLLAWFAFLTAAVALAARFVPVEHHAVLVIAALSPYLIAGSGLVTLPVLFTSLRWSAVPSFLIVTAMLTLTLAPGLGSHRGAPSGVPIRVLTVNLHEGRAEPAAVIGRARNGADLLVLQELTPEFVASLTTLEAEFPFRVIDAQQEAKGVGILSRYPITMSRRDPGYELGMIQAWLRVPGASSEVAVLATHLVGPWPQAIDGWRREIERMPATMTTAANATSGAVIVAGDFNATTDMRPFRRLLANEFTDAAVQSGTVFVRTFPADRSVPPLLGIDHILTRNSTATDLRTVRIPGTDHLGLSATVHVPS